MLKKISKRANFFPISIKGHTFEIEIPQGDMGETIGLMYRRELPDHQGMIFRRPCGGFWMKDTYVPLTVAFIQGNKIVDMRDMEPLTQQTYSTSKSWDKAIEFKQGVLQNLGINVGDAIEEI